MSLHSLDLADPAQPFPAALPALIRDADQRGQEFMDTVTSQPPAAFLQCDVEAVARALAALKNDARLTGHRFLEWGSGIGTVTLCAAALGYDACGIELQPELVEIARTLADDHDLRASFAAGSFVPAGDAAVDRSATYAQVDALDGFEALGQSRHAFDLVFAYPWPDEEPFIESLFDRHAKPGACLLLFDGDVWVTLQRKE